MNKYKRHLLFIFYLVEIKSFNKNIAPTYLTNSYFYINIIVIIQNYLIKNKENNDI